MTVYELRRLLEDAPREWDELDVAITGPDFFPCTRSVKRAGARVVDGPDHPGLFVVFGHTVGATLATREAGEGQ